MRSLVRIFSRPNAYIDDRVNAVAVFRLEELCESFWMRASPESRAVY